MRPLSRRLYAIAAIALAAIFFVGLNVAIDAGITTARIDLTENGRFTLSPGTRNIIRALKEPIRLRFFYSKKIAAEYAQTNAYAGRVRDLLQRYAALSNGKIILEQIDPEPFTAEEDAATASGLAPAPTESGDVVYFGLAGSNSIDGSEAIAYFSPEREAYLEYDLSSLIYRLATPEKPKLAILSSLPLDGADGQSRPTAIYREIAKTYDTQMLAPDFTGIPAGTSVLMIVQPGALNDVQNYAIDQFVMKGGRVLAFVDPNSELASAGSPMAPAAASSLPRLFHAWGVGFDKHKVIGDLKLAQRVQTADPRNPVAVYPVWLHLGTEEFDAHDPITANLQALNLASAGALTSRKGATTKFTPLVVSSGRAGLIDAEEIRLAQRPDDLIASIMPTGIQYAIAARITGGADTAFPDGPPGGTNLAQIRSAKNINIVVMADTDILDDRFWVRQTNIYGKAMLAPFADNGAFAINTIENLMGSDDLISLRTRATDNRPFTVVRQLQADAEAQYRQQAATLQARLTGTQARLHDLQQGEGGKKGELATTAKQQAEIDRFKRVLGATRIALRDVQHNLRKDIDALGEFLAFVNIALVPLLVAAFALVLATLRRRRRKRALKL